MRSISRSWPISDSNASTPPTAMFTGPCSAASEDRSAGERSCAICPRPYPGRKMAAVASSTVMPRSWLLALLAFGALASPALATAPTFEFPVGGLHYDPAQITLSGVDTSVCWSPQGVGFDAHPL